MWYRLFLGLISALYLHAEETCSNQLFTLLGKKQSETTKSIRNLLDQYELKQFQENNQNWEKTVVQLCKQSDCDCLIDHYQQRNIELSQKLSKAKSEVNTKIIKFTGEDTECGFGKSFPKEMKVYAAGSYQGMQTNYRIGEKGEKSSVFRLIVNSPKQPVALILGTYNAAIWDITWTEGTKIEAAYVMGYHSQAVSGLPKTVPVSIITIDKKWGCGSFTIEENKLSQINPLSNKLFHKNVDSVHFASAGYIHLGDPIDVQTLLFTSADTTMASLHRHDAPLQKEEALYDAVSKGILRQTTHADLKRWQDNLPKNANLPKVETPSSEKRKPFVHNGFVVLKPFTLPEGLYGGHSATFFVEKGVPVPTGNLGHSTLYDFNTMTCKGTACNINNF